MLGAKTSPRRAVVDPETTRENPALAIEHFCPWLLGAPFGYSASRSNATPGFGAAMSMHVEAFHGAIGSPLAAVPAGNGRHVHWYAAQMADYKWCVYICPEEGNSDRRRLAHEIGRSETCRRPNQTPGFRTFFAVSRRPRSARYPVGAMRAVHSQTTTSDLATSSRGWRST